MNVRLLCAVWGAEFARAAQSAALPPDTLRDHDAVARAAEQATALVLELRNLDPTLLSDETSAMIEILGGDS